MPSNDEPTTLATVAAADRGGRLADRTEAALNAPRSLAAPTPTTAEPGASIALPGDDGVSFSSVPCLASTVPFPMTSPYVGRGVIFFLNQAQILSR